MRRFESARRLSLRQPVGLCTTSHTVNPCRNRGYIIIWMAIMFALHSAVIELRGVAAAADPELHRWLNTLHYARDTNRSTGGARAPEAR